MKKLIFVLLVALVSCSKSSDKTNNSIVNEVLSIKDPVAQKVAFAKMLNSEEKALLFKARIETMLRENNFSIEQRELIEDLNNQITPKIYEDREQRDLFMKKFGTAWLDKAATSIGLEKIYKYLVNMNVSGLANFASNDCNCNQSSSYSCLGRDECKETTCTTSTYGCGFALLWSCDGKCTLLK